MILGSEFKKLNVKNYSFSKDLFTIDSLKIPKVHIIEHNYFL